ncbi:alpha/beta hydrolase [Nonomuraea deserti]|uniref:alpha/beta hydrolase n=1 Tax=Nonomuraea deserti TaxID=1848322 RepID=UPI003F6DFA3B
MCRDREDLGAVAGAWPWRLEQTQTSPHGAGATAHIKPTTRTPRPRQSHADLGGALATHRAFGRRAAFVTVEGWNHGILGDSCADGLIAGRIGHRTLPAKDVSCPAAAAGR